MSFSVLESVGTKVSYTFIFILYVEIICVNTMFVSITVKGKKGTLDTTYLDGLHILLFRK